MRVFDRLLSVVLSLLLLVLGLVVAVEVVHTLVGQAGHLILPWEQLARWAREAMWSDLLVRALAVAVTVVGLVLLVVEIRRRRPSLLTLSPRAEGVISGVTRTSLSRALAATADHVDGVRDASASLHRRRAQVTATTALRDPGNLQSRVDTTVSEWVEKLDLVATPTVRVRVKRKSST